MMTTEDVRQKDLNPICIQSPFQSLTQQQVLAKLTIFLSQDPPPGKILFLQGESGVGKSWLLHRFMDLCKTGAIPQNGQMTNRVPPCEKSKKKKGVPNAQAIPCAFLDFALQPRKEERPLESLFALFMLSRQIAEHNVHLPVFNFASVLYLYKTGQLVPMRLRHLFHKHDMELVYQFGEVLLNASGRISAEDIIDLIQKYFEKKEWSWPLHSKGNMACEAIEKMQKLPPEGLLLNQLTDLFAWELRLNVGTRQASRRFALIFDHCDALSNQNCLARAAQTRWFWQLVAKLHQKNGVLIVIAARQFPLSEKERSRALPKISLIHLPLSAFNKAQAQDFLKQKNVSNKKLREVLLARTQVKPNQYLPLRLCLGIELYHIMRKKLGQAFAEVMQQIGQNGRRNNSLEHLLLKTLNRDVMNAMIALSAAREFDIEMYLKLGTRLTFNATESNFQLITHFPFVQPQVRAGLRSFHFHEDFRRHLQDYGKSVVRRAHIALYHYYRMKGANGQNPAIAEAIYHLNRISGERGVLEWCKTFAMALENRRFNLCRALLAIQPEMVIESGFWRARMTQLSGDYYSKIGDGKFAEQAYRLSLSLLDTDQGDSSAEFEAANCQIITLQKLANLKGQAGQTGQAIHIYNRIAVICDGILKRDQNFLTAYLQKAQALQKVAKLKFEKGKVTEAESCFQNAQSCLQEVLHQAPEYLPALEVLVQSCNQMADLFLRQFEAEKAKPFLSQAVRICEEIKTIEPQAKSFLLAKSIAYSKSGQSLVEDAEYEKGLAHLKKSLDLIEIILESFPETVEIYLQKIKILIWSGQLYSLIFQIDLAQEYLDQALQVCQNVLKSWPGHPTVLDYQARTYFSMGELYLRIDDLQKSRDFFNRAKIDFEAVVWQNPGAASTLHNLALTQMAISFIDEEQSQYRAAVDRIEKAIQLFESREENPQIILSSTTNLALAYSFLAALRQNASGYDQFAKAIKKAQALREKLNRQYPYRHKLMLAFSQISCQAAGAALEGGVYDAALNHAQQAADWCERYLKKQPDHPMALLRLAQAQEIWADTQKILGEYDDAEVRYVSGLNFLEQTHKFLANQPYILLFQSRLKLKLARIKIARGLYKEAEALLHQAYCLVDSGSAFQNCHAGFSNQRGLIACEYGNLLATVSHLSEAEKKYKDALSHFDACLKKFPEDAIILNNQAIAILARLNICSSSLKMEDTEEAFRLAMRCLQKALEKAPYKRDMQYNQAVGLIYNGLRQRESENEISEKILQNADDWAKSLDGRNSFDIHFLRGVISATRADGYAKQLKAKKAVQFYSHAMSRFRQAEKIAPYNRFLLLHLAETMQKSGSQYMAISQFENALQSIHHAIQIYEFLVKRQINDVQVWYHKGVAHSKSGYALIQLSRYSESLSELDSAQQAFEAALSLAPELIDGYAKSGDVFLTKSLVLRQSNAIQQIEANFQNGIKAYDQVLQRFPNDLHALSNRGKAYLQLGELMANIRKKGQALWHYQQALNDFERVLQLDPRNYSNLKRKADAHLFLGDTQVSDSRYHEANENFRRAVEDYSRVLTHRRNDVEALYSKGVALANFGNTLQQLSQTKAALKSYRQAIACYREVIECAPSFGNTLFNLALTLASLGELFAAKKQSREASQCYQEAVATFAHCQKGGAKRGQAFFEQGRSLASLAELYLAEGHLEAAQKSYEQAISAHQQALGFTEENLSIQFELGLAFSGLASVQEARSNYSAAISSLGEAIKAYETVLCQNSEDLNTIFNKGLIHLRLGNLKKEMQDTREAQQEYEKAEASLLLALKMGFREPRVIDSLSNVRRAKETCWATEQKSFRPDET